MYKKIIKFSIYALVFLLPLFFLPFSFEAFEFNKGYLLFFLVSIGLLAWLGKMVFKDRQIVFRRTRLDFVVLGFAAIMILVAVFSKDTAASIYGFYGRFWPSLIGTLSMAGFYFLITNNVRVSEKVSPSGEAFSDTVCVRGLLKTFLISCGVIVVFAYLSVFGVWQAAKTQGLPLPLVMGSRAFNSTAGSLEALSMFLAFLTVLLIGLMAFGKTGVETAETGGHTDPPLRARGLFKTVLLILALGLLAIIDFWPAWFVLAASLFLFLGLAFWKRLFKKNANRLTLPILLFVLALLFVFANPLAGLFSQTRLANLPAEVFLRQSASWRLAWEGFKANPVLGSGLSNFSYAFSKYRPASFLQDNPFWQLRLDRAGSHIAELVATTGALGILAYLGLIGLFLFFSRAIFGKTGGHTGPPLQMAFIALVIAQFVYYQNTVLAFSFWFILALAAVVGARSAPDASGKAVGGNGVNPSANVKAFDFKTFPELGLVFSIIFWVILAGFGFFSFKLAQNYRADIYYRRYLTNPFQNLEKLKKAAQISSNSSVYHIMLARAYLAGFSEELQKTQPDSQTLNNMVALAVGESRKAAEISPHRVATYETSGIIYREIQGVAQGAIGWAIKSFERAIELEPRNPVFLTELGKLYLAQDDKEKASQMFEQAISIKDDYVDAYLQMSRIDEAENRPEQAQARLETLVGQNPFSVEARFQLGRLYYNNGEMDKAEEQFLAGLQLFPNHSNSLYSLGLVYERQGRLVESLEKFEKVLELNPGNEDVVSKLRALK